MSKLLNDLRIYFLKSEDSLFPYKFFISKKQNPANKKISDSSQIIYSHINSVDDRISLMLLYYENDFFQKEYEKKGLGSALTLIRFLFGFYYFGFSNVHVTVKEGRGGIMYTLLDMVKEFVSKNEYCFIGVYPEKAVELIQKSRKVKALIEKTETTEGITLDELISVYLSLGKTKKKNELGLGDNFINAANELKKRID